MAQQDLTYLLSEQARLLADIASLNTQLAYARASGNPQIVAGLELRLATAQELLSIVQSQIQSAGASLPVTSAGQIVASDQQARASGAVVQNPQVPPEPVQNLEIDAPATTNLSEEDLAAQNIEFGTNGRIRTVTETQATPQPTTLAFATRDEDGNVLPPTPSLNAGVGARSDDSPANTTGSVQQTINANFNQRIDPRPNILGDYVSYTYSISWYLLTPEQFNQLSVQTKKNISNWQLIMQTAGAPITPANGAPGRNEYFSNDYYLDNFILETAFEGKGTGSAGNNATLSFTVTEPNGFTLIENLSKAVTSYYQKNNVAPTLSNSTAQVQANSGDADAQEGGFYGNSNTANGAPPTGPNTNVWTNAQYCMVIRFYGYNETGDLVQVGKRTNPSGRAPTSSNSTDKNAVVEKFIPWTISDIDTKLASRTVEYQINGVVTPYIVAFSSQRGTIPYNYELAGTTVGEILNGRPSGAQYRRVADGRSDSAQPPATTPSNATNAYVEDTGVDFGQLSG
jgi:hypothetical protein